MIRWVGLPLMASILAFLTFRFQMAWPWPLALLISLSIAALAYSTQRAAERMLLILDPDDTEDLSGTLAPRSEQE